MGVSVPTGSTRPQPRLSQVVPLRSDPNDHQAMVDWPSGAVAAEGSGLAEGASGGGGGREMTSLRSPQLCCSTASWTQRSPSQRRGVLSEMHCTTRRGVVQGVGARRVGSVRRVGRCRGPTRRKIPTSTVVEKRHVAMARGMAEGVETPPAARAAPTHKIHGLRCAVPSQSASTKVWTDTKSPRPSRDVVPFRRCLLLLLLLLLARMQCVCAVPSTPISHPRRPCPFGARKADTQVGLGAGGFLASCWKGVGALQRGGDVLYVGVGGVGQGCPLRAKKRRF